VHRLGRGCHQPAGWKHIRHGIQQHDGQSRDKRNPTGDDKAVTKASPTGHDTAQRKGMLLLVFKYLTSGVPRPVLWLQCQSATGRLPPEGCSPSGTHPQSVSCFPGAERGTKGSCTTGCPWPACLWPQPTAGDGSSWGRWSAQGRPSQSGCCPDPPRHQDKHPPPATTTSTGGHGNERICLYEAKGGWH